MSLASILRDIGNWISKKWKSLTPIAKKAIGIAVDVTTAIKLFDTASPQIADIITRLIPGDKDDKAVALIRAKLPLVMLELKLVDETLGLTDPEEIVLAGIKVIQQMQGDYKWGTLNNLSIILARIAADGKLDWNDAVYLAKYFYDNDPNPDNDTSRN